VQPLLEASHKPHKTILGGTTVTLQPGQFISGNRDLEIATGVSLQRIKTSIKFFEKEGMISRCTGRHGTVFTVLQYAQYQGKNEAQKAPKSNPPATHQINPPTNPPTNPPKVSSDVGCDKIATRQSTHTPTHQQPAQLTRIQEDKTKRLKEKSKDIVGKPDMEPVFERVISHLNTATGKAFKNVKSHQKFISARIKEGYSESDLITVIDRKASEWLTDPRMNEYLRPSTLFNSEKFDGYLNSTACPASQRKSGPFIPDDNDLSWADDFYPYAPETF
jgi:uncharacterized phage protein (TIGR02220 family)